MGLRVLCLLGFLLLIAPFYDQCNGHGMKQCEAPAEEEPVTEHSASVIDSIQILQEKAESDSLIAQTIRDSIYEADKPLYQKTFEFIDDENNLSGFEFAVSFLNMSEGPFEEIKREIIDDLKKKKYSDLCYYVITFNFFCISLISLLLIVLSFLKKHNWISRLTIVNLISAATALLCIVFFDKLFETYKQIKWGYYAFFIVQICILVVCKKHLRKRNSSPDCSGILFMASLAMKR